MNTQRTTARRSLLVCAGFALFVVGVAVGVFAARLVPALRVAPTPDEGLLVQTGDIDAVNKPTEFEVFYPRPYASPPALKIEDKGSGLLVYQITEQRPDGFWLSGPFHKYV